MCMGGLYELNEIRDWIAQSNSISSKTLLNEWLIGDGIVTNITFILSLNFIMVHNKAV